MSTINIKNVEIEEKDFADFLIDTKKKRLILLSLISVLVAVILFIYIHNILPNYFALLAALFILAFSLSMLISSYMGIKRNAHNEIIHNKLFIKPRDYIFDSSGLATVAENDQNKILWGEVYKVVETKATFGIFASIYCVYLIPKRFVNSAADSIALKKLFSDNLAAAKLKLIK